MKNNIFILVFFVSIFGFHASNGQETLQQKYNQLVEDAETYERFKVIPITDLNAFWLEVSDTLSQKERKVQELQAETKDAKALAVQARAELSNVQAKLQESLELNDTIDFVGVAFSKLGYHIMVWVIIAVLAILAIMAYFMFLRSNSVTTRVRREHEALQAEYEKHRVKAREQQVKLKRELQTAVNKLSERRG